ncbi:MAG: hypothetical protein NVS3B7_13210 [Candidatus Elarobacter sp.]
MDTSLRVAFGHEIASAAIRHHLDPRLLAAVAAQETGGPGRDSGRNVVGDGGHGRGLFQIDDRWHPFARSPEVMDPAKNAEYAAGLIAANLRRFGDLRGALSAYNAGSPGAAGTRTDWGDGRPLGYADSVFRHYLRLRGGGAPGPHPSRQDVRDVVSRVDGLRGAAAWLGIGPASTMPFNPPIPFALPPGGHAAPARSEECDRGDLAPSSVDPPEAP